MTPLPAIYRAEIKTTHPAHPPPPPEPDASVPILPEIVIAHPPPPPPAVPAFTAHAIVCIVRATTIDFIPFVHDVVAVDVPQAHPGFTPE